MRLTPRGYQIGLASDERYQLMESKRTQRDAVIEFARTFSIKPALINPLLEQHGLQPLSQGTKLVNLILRPQLNIAMLLEMVAPFARFVDENVETERREEILEAAES